MRKLSFTLPLVLTVVVFVSCKKESAQPQLNDANTPASETFSVKIAPDESYTFNILEAGNVAIVKQAAHFSVSEAQQSENSSPSYKYIPAAHYTGNDEVVLLFSKSSASSDQSNSGCGNHTNSSSTAATVYKTLKITVGN